MAGPEVTRVSSPLYTSTAYHVSVHLGAQRTKHCSEDACPNGNTGIKMRKTGISTVIKLRERIHLYEDACPNGDTAIRMREKKHWH